MRAPQAVVGTGAACRHLPRPLTTIPSGRCKEAAGHRSDRERSWTSGVWRFRHCMEKQSLYRYPSRKRGTITITSKCARSWTLMRTLYVITYVKPLLYDRDGSSRASMQRTCHAQTHPRRDCGWNSVRHHKKQ